MKNLLVPKGFPKLVGLYLSLFDNGFLGKSGEGEWLFNGLGEINVSSGVKTSFLINKEKIIQFYIYFLPLFVFLDPGPVKMHVFVQ